jgi:hypothetical protein
VIKTIVITPSAAPIAETKHKSVSTGAIVGGVLGGLAGLLAIVGGVFFLLWRRRRQQQDNDGHHEQVWPTAIWPSQQPSDATSIKDLYGVQPPQSNPERGRN